MPDPERTILAASEHSITGTSLMTVEEDDHIRIEATEIEDGWTRYSVSSRLAMGRSAIASILATPMHYSNRSWEAVRDGLRDVSTPSTAVQRAARNTDKKAHLRAVGPASRELADIMTNNQSYQTQTANVQVFTANESLEYANDEILRRMSAGKLLNQLKSIGIDIKTAKRLSEFVHFSNQSEEVAKQLQSMVGLTDEEVDEAVNGAMLDQIDKRVWVELAYRFQESMFVGFVKEAAFNKKLEFGGDDFAVFLLESEVPKNIAKSAINASVEIGPKMRDPDKKTGRDRYEVGFLTEQAKILAYPQLVWDRKDDERRFAFPLNTFEQRRDGNVGRRSSILGAGLAANLARFKYGISYSDVLINRFNPKRNWNSPGWRSVGRKGAGMLPLVINYHEQTVLKDEYFLAVEDAVE